MSFTPEPGTPLATYYAQTKPRIGAVLAFEGVDVGLLVAVVGDSLGIGLRVVADVAGANGRGRDGPRPG